MFEFDPVLVHEWLRWTANRLPYKSALITGNRSISYAELNESSDQLAQGLMHIGVQRHDRVVVFMDAPEDIVTALYGILKSGAAFVILHGTVKTQKLTQILKNSSPRVLISHAGKAGIVKQACDGSGISPEIVWIGEGAPSSGRRWSSMLTHNDYNYPWPRTIDVDLAALIYTSGSTGEPKGVISTHHNMVSAARSIIQYLENREDDVILNVLPLSFDYGLYQVIMSVMFGGTVVLERSFAFPHLLLQRIAEKQVTGFPIVPTIAAMLLKMQDLSAYKLSSIRYISNTGASFPPDHIRRLRELLPGARVYSMYGLTECKRTAFLPPNALDRHSDSVGIAMPNCEIAVVREDGKTASPDEPGELVVRGSNVMQGYWRAPETTEKTYHAGLWRADVRLHSGDTFKQDEAGYLYFLGRKDDMIKSRGERISAKEVEYVLCEMPEVAEAAVIGLPDAILGQALKAFIVAAGHTQINKAAVKKFCMNNLELFMVPKYVEFLTALPYNANGKVDKTRLV